MKANYARLKDNTVGKKKISFTEKQLEQYLEAEFEKKRDEVYKSAVKDVSAQILATLFSTLYMPPYKWRKKRLLRLKENIEGTFSMMTEGNILGKNFSTEECISFMKKEFGIDFDKENLYK